MLNQNIKKLFKVFTSIQQFAIIKKTKKNKKKQEKEKSKNKKKVKARKNKKKVKTRKTTGQKNSVI